jgi:hypothetical protein
MNLEASAKRYPQTGFVIQKFRVKLQDSHSTHVAARYGSSLRCCVSRAARFRSKGIKCSPYGPNFGGSIPQVEMVDPPGRRTKSWGIGGVNRGARTREPRLGGPHHNAEALNSGRLGLNCKIVGLHQLDSTKT